MELDDLWDIVTNSKTGHVTVNKVLRWYKSNVDSDCKICTGCNYEVKFLYTRVIEELKNNYNYGREKDD